MARDDWRIRIELEDEERAWRFLGRLGNRLGSDEARRLARELEGRRLAVSRDGNELFVYAPSRLEAEKALAIVHAELAEEGIDAHTSAIEHWLADDDRWDADAPGPDVEEELLEEGYAPWEVRIECASHDEAEELADRLESEGYGVVRRFNYVIAGTSSQEEARELARRVGGEVEPGGELVWETLPGNPFAIFGGLGGSGTPI